MTFSISIVPTPPSITALPMSESVVAGQSVSLSASAAGSPTPTVQWQFSTDGGASYSPIAGATSLTYSFAALLSQNGELFEAVFSNSQGSATTTPATLVVSAPPAAPIVITNPTSQTVPAGQPGSFTASASGEPAPTVQWQISTDGGGSFNDISGATSTTYGFTASAGEDGDLFRAAFSNSQGSVMSGAATLSVAPPLTSPVVSAQPADQAALAGNTVTLTAAATANPTPNVQWQSTTDGTTFTDIPGATSAAFSFTATVPSATFYRAVFTNSQGTATTAAATLSVTPTQFVVSTPPVDGVPADQSFTFAASVTDPSGNIDTGFSGSATVALSPGVSAGATLGGTLTVPVTNGVATFSGLTLSAPGSYSLLVTSAATAALTTPAFNVTTPLSGAVPTITHTVLPASAIIGGKFNSPMAVVVRNTGAKQTGLFTIHLFADTGETLDGNQQLLATFSKKLSLKSGMSGSFATTIKSLPQSLPPGNYHILAEVVDPTGAINVTATSSSFTAAAPFVQLAATPGNVTPASIAANGSGSIIVTVKNTGNIQATGKMTITLAPSSDGISSLPMVLSSLSPTTKIAPNQSKSFRLKFKLSGNLATGMYFPYVTVALGGNVETAVGSVQFTVG